MMETCRRFCEYAKFTLEPSKSSVYGYVFDNITRRRKHLPENAVLFGDSPIKSTNDTDAFRYLGIINSAHKNSKLRMSGIIEEEFKSKLEAILNSKLMLVQKIHAIKTFLIPRLDFVCLNGQIKAKTIERLDKCIREGLNKCLSCRLPIQVFHSSWKDGGLSIPSLYTKKSQLVLRAAIQLLLSNDERVRKVGTYSLSSEKHLRCGRVEDLGDIEASRYFGWTSPKREGTNSIHNRAFKAASKLDINLCFHDDDEEIGVEIYDPIDKSSARFITTKGVSQYLSSITRRRWSKDINQNTFHLHSFNSLNDNPTANRSLVDVKWPLGDGLFRFLVKARTNNLPTKEFIEIMNREPHSHCDRCIREGKVLNNSLMHTLNGCVSLTKKYMHRHDVVAKLITEEVSKSRKIHRYKNGGTIDIPSGTIEPHLKALKPDLQIWLSESKVIIGEITIPYGGVSNGEEILVTRFKQKKSKYNDLVESLEVAGFEVTYIVIVVSSLGALCRLSLKDLKKVVTTDKKLRKIAEKISRAVIRLSFDIWKGNVITESRNIRNTGNINEDVEINGTDDSDDEFDGDALDKQLDLENRSENASDHESDSDTVELSNEDDREVVNRIFTH